MFIKNPHKIRLAFDEYFVVGEYYVMHRMNGYYLMLVCHVGLGNLERMIVVLEVRPWADICGTRVVSGGMTGCDGGDTQVYHP